MPWSRTTGSIRAGNLNERSIDIQLSFSYRGYLSLGIRTLLELRPYLTEIYEEHLVECVLCHDIVVKVGVFV